MKQFSAIYKKSWFCPTSLPTFAPFCTFLGKQAFFQKSDNIILSVLFYLFINCQEEPYYDYSIICEAMLTNYYNKSKKISIQKSKLNFPCFMGWAYWRRGGYWRGAFISKLSVHDLSKPKPHLLMVTNLRNYTPHPFTYLWIILLNKSDTWLFVYLYRLGIFHISNTLFRNFIIRRYARLRLVDYWLRLVDSWLRMVGT